MKNTNLKLKHTPQLTLIEKVSSFSRFHEREKKMPCGMCTRPKNNTVSPTTTSVTRGQLTNPPRTVWYKNMLN